MIRIGIIGAGTMANYHARILSQEPDAQIVAVASTSPERARALAESVGAQVEESPRGLLQRDDLEAVVVATPTPYHREYVELAASAGLHVFCEKPLARTLEDGEAMVDAVTKAGVKLGVGHVVRWFPEYYQARELVQQGALGTVGTVRTIRVNAFPRGTRNWYADYGLSGGVILDMSIHDIDWLLWTFGPVRRVYAQLTSDSPERMVGMVSLRHESGAICYVEGSWAHMGFATSLEVAGSEALLTTDSASTRPLELRLKRPEGERPAVEVPVRMPARRGPYEEQDHAWVRWLLGGPEPRCSGQDALASLRVGLAALESAQRDVPVTL